MPNLMITLLLIIAVDHYAMSASPTFNDWIVTGETSMRQRDFDQAIFFFSRAIEEDPQNVIALLLRSKAYMNTDRYHEATQDYRTAVAIDQEQVKSYLKRKKNKGRTGMLIPENTEEVVEDENK